MKALVVIAALARLAHAGGVTGKVTVSETDGRRVFDAVVVVYVVGFTEPAPKADAITATIEQLDRHFVPDLVAITAGEAVQFPNRDPLVHNVFSPSKLRKFDLGTFKRGDAKSRTFPTAGVVDVFCNIHVEMAATVLVLPNRAHVTAKPSGVYRIDNVPPGTWTVFAYTRRMVKPVTTTVTITADGTATADFSLVRGPEPPHDNKFGEEYGGYK